MKERRYRKNFRVVPGEGGGKRRVEYVGEYFRYLAGGPSSRDRARFPAASAGAYWIASLAYLRTARATSRCLYAAVPMMIGLLPGVYLVLGLASMLGAPERLTIVQKENGPGRLTRAALGCGIFSAIGAAGCAVYLSIHGLWAPAWHEPLLAAIAAAAAWAAFARARESYRALEKA
ncbi:MAG: hypothetical protein Q4C10_09415 [Clostridia bacterium]|nr:hypothetical protein [Clostridia bacterium]